MKCDKVKIGGGLWITMGKPYVSVENPHRRGVGRTLRFSRLGKQRTK